MNRLFKKLTAMTLVIALTSCFFAVPTAAEPAGSDDSLPAYRGVYYYRPVLGEFDGNSLDDVDRYAYSDDYFAADSGVYNEHLATFSMLMSECSVSSSREPSTAEGYKQKGRNAAALLEDNGFADIEANNDYKSKPGNHTIGVMCAHKTVTVSGEPRTLIAVVPRSAGYEKEWTDNFTIGSEGDAKASPERSAQSVSPAKSSDAACARLPPEANGRRMRAALRRRTVPFRKARSSPPEAIPPWSTVRRSFAISRRTLMLAVVAPADMVFFPAIGMPLEETEE